MFGELNATEEYNNAGALLGLDGENDELVGEVLAAEDAAGKFLVRGI